MISRRGLMPNMMTYGCLAMGCNKMDDGLQLISDMQVSAIVVTFHFGSVSKPPRDLDGEGQIQ